MKFNTLRIKTCFRTINQSEGFCLFTLMVFIVNLLANVKQFIDAGGIKLLVELVVLAHLHTSRATVPLQTTMIEASVDQLREYAEKEWYFGDQKERRGPYSYPEV